MTEQEKQKLINITERLLARFEELDRVERYLQSLNDPDFDPELPDDFDINNFDLDSDPDLDRIIDEMREKRFSIKIS